MGRQVERELVEQERDVGVGFGAAHQHQFAAVGGGHIWDETREKGFANQLFATLADVEVRLKTQLDELAANSNRLRSLTAFPWLAL